MTTAEEERKSKQLSLFSKFSKLPGLKELTPIEEQEDSKSCGSPILDFY